MIGSLVNWQAPWGGPVHWGVIVDVRLDTEHLDTERVMSLTTSTARVRWFSEQIKAEWWDVNQLAFVTSPVNDGGEGNVAEDIKRKT